MDPLSGECLTSDPDATWGCHNQFGTDSNGKEVQTKKRWFGYELHLLGDVNYELPIGFTLAPAHESGHPHCEALVSEFIGSQWSRRCESFVADRGLDSNRLKKRLFEADILSVIANRNLWQDENLDSDQLRVATRSLDENQFDTLLRTEHGDLYCKCPQSEQIRPMHYQGYEKSAARSSGPVRLRSIISSARGRDECYRAGNVTAGAKTRVVRVKVVPDHLRDFGESPHSTLKWKRLYKQRSALERIHSRIADSFLMHHHYLRGQRRMALGISMSMTVMLAAACFASEAGQPQNMRSLVNPLAA